MVRESRKNLKQFVRYRDDWGNNRMEHVQLRALISLNMRFAELW